MACCPERRRPAVHGARRACKAERHAAQQHTQPKQHAAAPPTTSTTAPDPERPPARGAPGRPGRTRSSVFGFSRDAPSRTYVPERKRMPKKGPAMRGRCDYDAPGGAVRVICVCGSWSGMV